MEWIKVFHVMMMTSWFAGLFYLPRLFVNHAMTEHQEVHAQLSLMERKLYRFVTPMMILTLITGSTLAYLQWDYLKGELWFALKVGVVALLVAYHFYCGHLVNVFREDKNIRSHKFYRLINEIPVLPLVVVVYCVIAKPF